MKTVMTIVLGLAIVLSSTLTMAANKKTAEAAIAAAETSRKNAASVEGEWRDTGKMIKKAEAAMKEGNFAKAVKLANSAKRQGKYGYEQAVAQKKLKIPSYLKY